jgi:hypothetical protein
MKTQHAHKWSVINLQSLGGSGWTEWAEAEAEAEAEAAERAGVLDLD